jgi:hypothetical protein
VTVEIVALHVSARHAFEGRPSDGPRPDPAPVGRVQVEIRAGLGIVGDRYFNHPAHQKAAVTVFAAESLAGIGDDPLAVRRNIVLRGFPVDELTGTFSLDTGDGPIRFEVHRRANPCAWMDVAVAPGAFKALRGHGGMRCVPLDDGVLKLGPAALTVIQGQLPLPG